MLVGIAELDRVPAAQDHAVAAAAAFQPREVALTAGRTVGGFAQRVQVDLPDAVVPQLEHLQRAADGFAMPAQNLDRFTSLQRGDDIDDGPQDPGRIARSRRPGWRSVLQQAAQARGFAGQDRHRLAFGTHTAAVDPGDPELDGGVVQQEPGLEVVRPVYDDVDIVQPAADRRGGHIRHDRFDLDLRVDLAELRGRGHRLGQTGRDIFLVVQHLPLEIV